MTTPQGIRDYLAQTVTKGGSDLHLTVGAPPAARVHGSLQALEEMSFDAGLSPADPIVDRLCQHSVAYGKRC